MVKKICPKDNRGYEDFCMDYSCESNDIGICRRNKCPSCGSLVDATVVKGKYLLLFECPKCGHRW